MERQPLTGIPATLEALAKEFWKCVSILGRVSVSTICTWSTDCDPVMRGDKCTQQQDIKRARKLAEAG
jgi:hypothetical protein